METQRNSIGLTIDDYKGLPTTLCTGCGHESLNSCLISACFDLGVPPSQLMRLSGIGCSSKSPNYIVDRSYAFNGVHGRMATIATGVHLANHRLVLLGLSGDGDTASIGMGNFVHLIRRNPHMVYIMENNGTYGLTKGQFSPTTDRGSKTKKGKPNVFRAVDCAALAIEMGATFVARGFVGAKEQLTHLIKAAFLHKGFAFIDIISPCVSFGNHEGSTKSFAYVRQHLRDLHEARFVAAGSPAPDMNPTQDIPLPNGAHLLLKDKEASYNPRDRYQAVRILTEAKKEGQIVTGLLYFEEGEPTLEELLKLDDKPLVQFKEQELRLPQEEFDKLIATYR